MGIVLDPTTRLRSHPSEEILEEYVFHRLPDTLIAPLEEHLLICPACQDAVTGTDQFIAALRAAPREPAPPSVQEDSGWWETLAPGRPAMALLLALVVLGGLLVRKQAQEPRAEFAVSLTSLRGPDSLSPSPAGKPLELTIDAPDLTPDRAYRVELVDAAGKPVWKGPVTESGGKLVAHMPKLLGKGMYWVRLYGANSELLREFGLLAR